MSSQRSVFLQGFTKLSLTVTQREEMLADNKWAQLLGLEATEVAQLAAYLIPYRGGKGATVFRKGDEESFMCLICSGGVHIFNDQSQSAGALISSIGPNNTVGEMALIDGEPRSAYAYTASETVLFVMTRSNFLSLAEANPTIWGKLLLRMARLMSHRLRKANEFMAEHLH